MADTPTNGTASYVTSILILFLLGIILIGGVLYLRPTADPLVVIGVVFGFLVSCGASMAAFLKSNETHLTVNSQLSSWKAEFGEMAHSRGIIEGTKSEQERIVEQKRVATLTAVQPTLPQTSSIPVTIISPDPLPVQVKDPK